MKNLLTLSAIWFGLMLVTARANTDYKNILASHDYAKAVKLLQKAQINNETLDGLLRYIGSNDTLRLYAIHRLIDVRCHRYLSPQEADQCGEATLTMLRHLDFDIRFLDESSKTIPAFVFVAFEAQLIELLNQETTGQYLELLARKFEDQTFHSAVLFNLWDETLAFHDGNQLQALLKLAVLFQDTSTAQIHLEYLARRQVEGSRFFNPNVARLARVLEQIVRLQNEQPQLFNQIAYPAWIGASLNSSIYHYYVPWFLAAQLREQGTPPRFAGIAPLMLSITYEFITSRPDYRHLILDPQTVQQTWTMKDIYAGLSGATQGAQARSVVLPFAEFEGLIHQDTTLAVQRMLQGF